MFKDLSSTYSDEAEIVNNCVMQELEARLTELEYINLLDEVYE